MKSVLGGTLGVVALAFGVGVLGAYMLDLHKHQCEACGHRWWHFGAFNLGDLDAHTCKCGTVQWWKCGWQHVGGMTSTDGAFRPLSTVPGAWSPRGAQPPPFSLALQETR